MEKGSQITAMAVLSCLTLLGCAKNRPSCPCGVPASLFLSLKQFRSYNFRCHKYHTPERLTFKQNFLASHTERSNSKPNPNIHHGAFKPDQFCKGLFPRICLQTLATRLFGGMHEFTLVQINLPPGTPKPHALPPKGKLIRECLLVLQISPPPPTKEKKGKT